MKMSNITPKRGGLYAGWLFPASKVEGIPGKAGVVLVTNPGPSLILVTPCKCSKFAPVPLGEPSNLPLTCSHCGGKHPWDGAKQMDGGLGKFFS